MVREFEETPNDHLVIVLDPWLPADVRLPKSSETSEVGRMALQRLEDAISLAATVCWEWCQQSGNRLVLAVADKEPLVIHGETGHELRLRMLRALAGVAGYSEPDVVQLVVSMRPILPPGPILVLTTSPGNLQATLEREFHRPVTCIHVAGLEKFEFFEW
jgi:uncharacterized protein (DUF58 family)